MATPNIFAGITGSSSSATATSTSSGGTTTTTTTSNGGTTTTTTISGSGGNGNNISINTVNGNSTLVGGNANDLINGGNGNDSLVGGNGNDFLSGGNGKDVLIGGNGNDNLYGGNGADILTGGSGNDVFRYKSVSDSTPVSRDLITDFAGKSNFGGDKIDLSAIDANSIQGGKQAFTFIGSSSFTAAGQVRYAGGILEANINGSLGADFQVRLVGAPQLVVSDLIL